jgi:hypothetical protein
MLPRHDDHQQRERLMNVGYDPIRTSSRSGRRTFATCLNAKGVGMRTIKMLMGVSQHRHKSIVLRGFRRDNAECGGVGVTELSGFVARSVPRKREQGTSAQVIVNSFAEWYKKLGFVGCSSHSGRRSFITQAARKGPLVGGALGDVMALESRYIETDCEALAKLVNLV